MTLLKKIKKFLGCPLPPNPCEHDWEVVSRFALRDMVPDIQNMRGVTAVKYHYTPHPDASDYLIIKYKDIQFLECQSYRRFTRCYERIENKVCMKCEKVYCGKDKWLKDLYQELTARQLEFEKDEERKKRAKELFEKNGGCNDGM